ncbi:Lamin Tail Domain [Robiginitalea myxolifaciens]|uniref:Lamin Tail Domain n=1 Tax=Robiginitalea myxolifaciens TaxID=400055 RepID=A0A1I6G6U2_9FLAO|nr:DUF5689 domain-containing protein [Robiginitalea myxolifaciens]SFR37870.1 Lamin Tail Domain [Robiginitalea myxolifaciens]
MTLRTSSISLLTLVVALHFLWNCNPASEEAQIPDPCETVDSLEIIPLDSLLSLYRGSASAIDRPYFLELRVVSSDLPGNIFGALYLQEKPGGPGLLVKTDLLDTHAYFPEGSLVRLDLQGLFLDKEGSGLALGSPREVFGNITLDRIPAAVTLERLSLACGAAEMISPLPIPLDSLKAIQVHSLVALKGLEIDPENTIPTYAEYQQETLIPLVDCFGGKLNLVNSGYSDFYQDTLPAGNGTVTGILRGSPGEYQILLRDAEDLEFDQPDCNTQYPPMQSDRILISEIADPENDAGARFIELYNSDATPVRLDAWKLVRFTNGNDTPGGMVPLDGLRLLPGETLVIAARGDNFSAVYGIMADLLVRTNGPADSNGDDNIVLLDPFDQVVDVFGIPGEDGSGTAHEFEDGRALRRAEIETASPVFLPEQWIISNDTGAAGTLLQPGQAPEDYTPGKHPDSN